MGTRPRTELVLGAVNMALWQRRSEALMHRSSQGTQCTSIGFGLRWKEAGMKPSVGWLGDAYDNVRAHRAQSVPKSGRGEDGRLRIHRRFHNPRKGHSRLDDPSPTRPVRSREVAARGRLLLHRLTVDVSHSL